MNISACQLAEALIANESSQMSSEGWIVYQEAYSESVLADSDKVEKKTFNKSHLLEKILIDGFYFFELLR